MEGVEQRKLIQASDHREQLIDSLLNAEDVARILRIAKKTVHKLVREGKLGCVQVTEKDRRFTREQVQAYINSQTVEVRIDRPRAKAVKLTLPKGGEKSLGVSRTSLQEEMSRWR